MYDQLCGEILKKTPTSLVVDVQGVGLLSRGEPPDDGGPPRRLGGRRSSSTTARPRTRSASSASSTRPSASSSAGLLKVNGVGPAHALALLSASAPGRALGGDLRDGNERRLTASKGIGQKIAQRLITELKDEAARRVPRAARVAAAGLPPAHRIRPTRTRSAPSSSSATPTERLPRPSRPRRSGSASRRRWMSWSDRR